MSYTSTSEFDIDRRVHLTNEIPPYDMFDALNSSIQTDFWKWILGSSQVETKMPYTVLEESSSGTYESVHDVDSGEVYYKMVNGTINGDYGPQTEDDEYHSLIIDGVLLPEFDLLLHEAYRYLGTLYPDHPDFRELLTDVEFNDKINAAGQIIDYVPNNRFFEEVAKSTSDSEDNDDEEEEEADMLKIRNLWDEAFRRKLYGSKAGYRMFASDIFQNVTVFPVATMLPIKPVKQSVLATEDEIYNDASLLKAWNTENGFEYTADEYKNYQRKHSRVIDTYSKYYYKKFRLVDWDGSNSSYTEPTDTNVYAFGMAVPCKEIYVIEYPNVDDTSSSITSSKVGNFVDNSDITCDTEYVSELNDDAAYYTPTYNTEVSTTYGNLEDSKSGTIEVHSIKSTIRNPIPYKTMNVLPDITGITFTDYQMAYLQNTKYFPYNSITPDESNTSDTSRDVSGFINTLFGSTAISGFTGEDVEGLFTDTVDVCVNPYCKNTIFFNPSETLKFYKDAMTGYTNEDGDVIVVHPDPEWTDNGSAITRGTILIDTIPNPTDGISASNGVVVTNFNYGYIDVDLTDDSSSGTASHTIPSLETDARYGLVVENEDGDYVVFLGAIEDLAYEYTAGYYVINSYRLRIEAIPEEKTANQMAVIYSGYASNISEQEELNTYLEQCEAVGADLTALRTYVEYEDDTTSEEYIAARKILVASDYDYANALTAMRSLIELEETLAGWKKNRDYIVSDETFTDTSGTETFTNNQSLVMVSCATVKGLVGTVAQTKNAETGEYNTTVTYSTSDKLGVGEITDMSLGDFSVGQFYDAENGGELLGDDYPVNLSSKSVTVTSVSGNTANVNLPYYDEVRSSHDKTFFTYNSNRSSMTSFEYSNHAYSYFSDSFDSYLIDTSSTNYTMSIVERTDIDIECVIDIETEGMENVLTFDSDTSRELFKSLSVGDTVVGPSVDSDDETVFIISLGDDCAYLSQNLLLSGTFTLTFSVKTLVSEIDISENMSQYKEDLYNNGLYSVTNPFDHGLWPSSDYPNVSTAILDSLPDVSFYEPFNYVPSDSQYKPSFLLNMDAAYYDVELPSGTTRAPANIKFANDLFVEYNLNKILYVPDEDGEKTEMLMSVDWLDYMENNLKRISRATDNVSVGVNLMMETDTTGYFSVLNKASYTDPQIHLKFITLNLNGANMWQAPVTTDSDDYVVPAYAQIGSGGSGRKSWFKSPDDVSYPSIWGATQYDRIRDPDEVTEVADANGELKKNNVWGQDKNYVATNVVASVYDSVEDPVFEIPISEFDNQVRYLYRDKYNVERNLTTTQISFYAQTFDNIIKYFDADHTWLNMISQESSTNEFIAEVDNASEIDDTYITTKSLKYGGDWVPSKTLSSNGTTYDIVYPSITETDDIMYYTIDSDITLTNITDEGTVTFTKPSVLFIYFKDGEEYLEVRQFLSSGIIGTGVDYDADGEETRTAIASDSVYPPTEDWSTLSSILMYYYRVSGYITESYAKTYRDDVATCLAEAKEWGITDFETYINYYYYVGDYSGNYPNSTRDLFSEYYEDIFGLEPGNRFGVVYLSGLGQFKMFKILDNNSFSRELPIVQYADMTDNEFAVFTGSGVVAAASGWGIDSLIGNVSSSFTLPRCYITKGSFNFDIIADAGFSATGYMYDDDTNAPDTSTEVKFNITKGAIYKDSTNDAFYVYSTLNDSTDTSTHRFAIKFNEQKYFKNVLKSVGVYQIRNSLEDGTTTVTQSPIMSAVSELDLGISKISEGDRILEVKEIQLRSLYSTVLEPIFFSNYSSVSGHIYGINDDKELVVSDIADGELSTRLNFAVDLQQLLPITFDYDEDSDTYSATASSETTFDFTSDSSEYEAPEVIDPSITKSLIQDTYGENLGLSVDREFRFFKNNLIIRAKVMSGGKIINPSDVDSVNFTKALDLITVGDTVVSGFALDSLSSETIKQVQIIDSETGAAPSGWYISSALFKKGTFLAVSADGVAYFNDNCELSTLGTQIECKRLDLVTVEGESSLSSQGLQVNGLDFDPDTGSYLLNIGPADTSKDDALADITSEDTEYTGADGTDSDVFSLSIADASSATATNASGSSGSFAVPSRYTGTIPCVKLNNSPYGNVVTTTKYGSLSSISASGYSKPSASTFTKIEDNTVLLGIGKMSTLSDDGSSVIQEDINVFYKDHALTDGSLTLSKSGSSTYGYSVSGLSNSPSQVYNLIGTDAYLKGSYVVPGTSWRRCISQNDNSGKYAIYAKGSQAFIKSPTALVSFDSTTNDYEYNGDTSVSSYWKAANIPVITNNLEMTYRDLAVNTPDTVTTYVNAAYQGMVALFDALDTAMSADSSEFSGYPSNFERVPSQSFYTNHMKPVIKAHGDGLISLSSWKTMFSTAKSSGSASNSNGYVTVTYSSAVWTVTLKGFDLSEHTVVDTSVVATIEGADDVLLPTIDTSYSTSFTVNDSNTTNLATVWAKYMYIIARYLFMADTATGYNLSAGINQAVFTNTTLMLIDDYGSLSSIALSSLTKKEDIEDQDNWSSGAIPTDVTFTTKINNGYSAMEKFFFRDSSGNIAIIKSPGMMAKISAFRPACTYVSDDGIFIGGYIMSQSNIINAYMKQYYETVTPQEIEQQHYHDEVGNSYYYSSYDANVYGVTQTICDLWAYEYDSDGDLVSSRKVYADGSLIDDDDQGKKWLWCSLEADGSYKAACTNVTQTTSSVNVAVTSQHMQVTYTGSKYLVTTWEWDTSTRAGTVMDQLDTILSYSNYYNKSTPALLYSVNDGKTFSLATLPCLPDTFGYNEDTESFDASVSITQAQTSSSYSTMDCYRIAMYQGIGNYYIASVRKIDSEYHLFMKNTGISSNLGYYYYVGLQDNGSYDFTTFSYREMDETEIALGASQQVDTNAVTGTGASSILAASVVNNSSSSEADALVSSSSGSVTDNESTTASSTGYAPNTFSSVPVGNSGGMPEKLFVPLASEQASYISVSSSSGLDIQVGGTSIQSKTTGAFVLANPLSTKITSSVDCLLSINIKKDVPNTVDYLNTNYMSKYVDGFGRFKVTEITQVESSTVADRMYSYRELLDDEQRDSTSKYYDPLGYPSIDEDEDNRVFYNWASQTLTDGSVVYVPTEFTNSEGNVIKLCDASGYYHVVINENGIIPYAAVDLVGRSRDMLRSAYETTYDTVEDADSGDGSRLSDKDLSDLIGTTGLTFSGFSTDVDFPRAMVKTSCAAGSLTDYMFAGSDRANFINFINDLGCYVFGSTRSAIEEVTYTDDDGNEQQMFSLKQLVSTTLSYSTVFNRLVNAGITEGSDGSLTLDATNYDIWSDVFDTDYYILDGSGNQVTKYTTLKGLVMPAVSSASANVNGNVVLGTLGTSTYYAAPGDAYYVWYDNEHECYPFKSVRFFNSTLFMPYSFAGGATAMRGKDFSEVYTASTSTFTNPPTGVYLDENGYGGTRNNTDEWINTMPWTLDPDAFTSGYLKNTDGRYVYLTDKNGQKIKSNVAENVVTAGTDVNVSLDSFKSGSLSKTLTFKQGSSSTSAVIYAVEDHDVDIYCAASSLVLGSMASATTLLILDNGKVINDDVTVTFYYVGTAQDGDDEKVTEDFSISDECLQYEGKFTGSSEFLEVTGLKISAVYSGTTYTKTIPVASVASKYCPSIILEDGTDDMNKGYPLYLYKTSDDDNYSEVTASLDGSKTYTGSFSFSIFYAGKTSTSSVTYSNLSDYSSANESTLQSSKTMQGLNKFYVSVIKQSAISAENLEVTLEDTSDSSSSLSLSIVMPVFDAGTFAIYKTGNICYSGSEAKNAFLCKLYLNDRLLDASTGIGYAESYNASTSTLSITLGSGKFTVPVTTTYTKSTTAITSRPLYVTYDEGFILSSRTSSLNIQVEKGSGNSSTNPIYGIGLTDYCLIRIPTYDTFYELINGSSAKDGLGTVIDAGDDSILWTYEGTELSSISAISTDSNCYKFSEAFDISSDDLDLNDGNEHYLQIKLLTQKSVDPVVTTMNNSDNIYELSLSEMDMFPPDRVWFNPDGYPEPPIKFSNAVYNAENNEYYYNSSFSNKNGHDIYRANESGQIIGFKNTSSGPESFVLTRNNRLSMAQIPQTPINESCAEWFENKFYCEGHESNPFWQVLNITSTFDSAKKKWVQSAKTYEYQKSTSAMVKVLVDDDDNYLNVEKPVRATIHDSNVDINTEGDYLNTTTGNIQFCMKKPAAKYQTTSNFIKYGIQAINPFADDAVWTGTDKKINCYLDSTYTVNSLENLANPRDKTSEVASITEFGLFNKYHKLIAYAVFPPIEYRTSSQHLSFTCYVVQGSCVDPETLV